MNQRRVVDGRPVDMSLKALLESLLAKLEWTQEQLAKEAAEIGKDPTITTEKISRWKSNFQRPREDELIAVGMALFIGYRKKLHERPKTERPKPIGRVGDYWTICALFNNLLNKAGFATLDSGNMNRTWAAITESIDESHELPKIYIGWTGLKHYCPTPSKDHPIKCGPESGYAYELAETVAKMLNFEVQWVYFNHEDQGVFRDMIISLRKGEIDAIGPFMFQIPSREPDLLFTDSIGFMERFVVIAGDHSLARTLKDIRSGMDGQHHLVFIHNDASEVMGRILLPTNVCTSFSDETKLLNHIKYQPRDDQNRLRMFVTGAIDSERLKDDIRFKELATVDLHTIESIGPSQTHRRRKAKYTFYLPTAFAVRDTEPKLAQAINNCLRILKSNGYIYQYLKSNYAGINALGDKVIWEDNIGNYKMGK